MNKNVRDWLNIVIIAIIAFIILGIFIGFEVSKKPYKCN